MKPLSPGHAVGDEIILRSQNTNTRLFSLIHTQASGKSLTQILCVFVTYNLRRSARAPSPRGAADRNRLPLTVWSRESSMANSYLAGCVLLLDTSQRTQKSCKVDRNLSEDLQRSGPCRHPFDQEEAFLFYLLRSEWSLQE